MRVHELAKKLGLTNKDLLTLMEDTGMTGKTHSSGLEPNQIAEIEAHAKAQKAGKSAGGGAKGGGGAALQAPRPAPRPISRPTTPPPRSRGGGPTPSASAPSEGFASKTRGLDRHSRVQRMLIQRKLARRGTGAPEPEPQPEPEITIQIIEEKEPPKSVKPTPPPQVKAEAPVEPVETPKPAPEPGPEERKTGRPARGAEPAPTVVPEAGVVPDLDAEGQRRKGGRKRGPEEKDKKGVVRPKRGPKEKGRVKDQTREVITDGIEILKEIVPIKTEEVKAPRPAWPGAAQRRPGPPRGRPAAPSRGGGRGRKSIRREQKMRREQQLQEQQRLQEEQNRIVSVNEATTVADLAEGMRVPVTELIGKLMGMGVFAAKNQRLDRETIEIVCQDLGFEIRETSILEESDLIEEDEVDRPEDMKPRPPVVTIMGHVDHGKTKLLDAVRNSNVVDGEYGGITQHIGAYDVKLPQGRVIFLDTPGHEAFTAMRARGAMVTDVVVLVVAADDGVMPQTVEALSHAKAAGVPIVVAVNKIDKEGADIERVRSELSSQGLVPEQWGGKTPVVEISALKKIGIQNLLEVLLLESEVLELKSNPSRRAKGTIIEAKMDQGRGPVATVLVQSGTLRIGDSFVTGIYSGKVRALLNDRGEYVEEAGPATPVEVLGIEGVPVAGDLFMVVPDERGARQISLKLQQIQRARDLRKIKHVTLEDLHAQISEGAIKELNLIVRADVQGSVGALIDALDKIPSDKVKTNVIHSGVGTVSESDVMLASASNALILGFNIRPTPPVQDLAERENVAIRTYRVIYDAIADIRAALEGLLESKYKEFSLGRCEIREVFRADAQLVIAGGYVISGKMLRNAKMRILRDDVVVHEGKLDSLRRFKEDVKEVASGYECGIGVSRFGDVKVGDIIECYDLEEVKQTLDN